MVRSSGASSATADPATAQRQAARCAVARPRRDAAGRRSASAIRSSAALQATYRLAPAGLLLLRLRGGDLVRHRPAHRAGARRPRIKASLGERFGDEVAIDGRTYRAFPRPARLLEAARDPGSAAREGPPAARPGRGRARRAARHGAPPRAAQDEALAELQALHGVGPFTAEGTLLRGCGVVDELPQRPDDRRGDRRLLRPAEPARRRDLASDHRGLAARTGCGPPCCSGWAWNGRGRARATGALKRGRPAGGAAGQSGLGAPRRGRPRGPARGAGRAPTAPACAAGSRAGSPRRARRRR